MNRHLILLGLVAAMALGQEIADPETTTPDGCTCNTLCGASLSDKYRRDWCRVDGSCGQSSKIPFKDNWDYCLYEDSARPKYSQMDWTQKHDFIWNNIKADATLGAYHEKDVIKESVITSFQNEWDIMPAGRRKIIHAVGAICPFSVDVPADSPFTGLFKPGGTIHGFIRMGAAANIESGKGLTPGAAIKFLRTGTKSANIFLLHTTNPLPDNNHNFFATPLKNHITGKADSIASFVLNKKFCGTGHCITKVGLSDVCAYDQDGQQAVEPNFPFKVTFDLTGEVNFNEAPPADNDEFMDEFRNIPVGTRLYTINAMRHPDDAEGFSVGDVVTTDNCVSSYFGDTKLFFKHQWIEDDVALRPEWIDAYSQDCLCNYPSA